MIVCAYNEARCLPACLYSLLAQTRSPDEIVVVDNASTDETGAVARAVPGVRVVDEPVKGLVVAREAARVTATADILAYAEGLRSLCPELLVRDPSNTGPRTPNTLT